MVARTATQAQTEQIQKPKFIDLPEQELRWCSVKLNEIFERGLRIEASVFDIEGKHAREILQRSQWRLKPLTGKSGFVEAYHRPRFRRIWVENSPFPIYQPSQVLEIFPQPSGYLSERTDTDMDALRVKKGQIVLTCSGTIGNCAIIGETLDNQIFSHDLIRINCNNPDDAGFIYTFLRSKVGQALITTNEYGSVVSHIEPEHLEKVVVPDCSANIKKQISDKAIESFKLRDESNALLKKAEGILIGALDIKPIDTLKPRYFENNAGVRNYNVMLSKLNNRCDGSYHVPIVEKITALLKQKAKKIKCIGDNEISQRIILPGRFKRVYVEEGQGTVFFGGKQLYELDPSNKKFLSLGHHAERIKRELQLEENMIMITCSGTIGKVTLVPKHWVGWTANQHIIRVVPASDAIAGYLYVFLVTEYGRELITRFTYGSVVDEVDANHVSRIPIPLLNDDRLQRKINSYALLANERRSLAYQCEQDAIQLMNEHVIHSGDFVRRK